MLLDHIWGILDRVARLLIGACEFQDMRGQHVAYVVRSMGKQARQCAPASVGIIDAVALDCQPPCLIEGGLVICGVRARLLHRFDEQCAGILAITQKHPPMTIDVATNMVIQVEEVGEHQAEWFRSEERRVRILEGICRNQDFPALIALALTKLATPHLLKTSFRGRKMAARAQQQLSKVLLSQSQMQAETQHQK